jgi:hypothetical protein
MNCGDSVLSCGEVSGLNIRFVADVQHSPFLRVLGYLAAI